MGWWCGPGPPYCAKVESALMPGRTVSVNSQPGQVRAVRTSAGARAGSHLEGRAPGPVSPVSAEVLATSEVLV